MCPLSHQHQLPSLSRNLGSVQELRPPWVVTQSLQHTQAVPVVGLGCVCPVRG